MLVVTGPTGNVGAEVARLLVERSPVAYRIAAWNPDEITATHGATTPVVRFDYDDPTTWDAVLAEVDTLFLVFPLPNGRAVRTRMKPFLDAAVAAGARHIVYVSVPGAAHVKANPHYQVERHIEASGVAYTFLRCTYFMQNFCRAVSLHGADIMEHGEVFIPAGQGRTAMIDSRDVAAVVLDILLDPAPHANRAYLLTGPELLSFGDAAAVFSEVFGRPIRYTDPGLIRFVRRMRRRGLKADVLFFMTLVYFLIKRGRQNQLTDELAGLLGGPPTTLRQFVEDYRPKFAARDWTDSGIPVRRFGGGRDPGGSRT